MELRVPLPRSLQSFISLAHLRVHIQISRTLLHRTLADGDFRPFAGIASHLTETQADLIVGDGGSSSSLY
jgi:hypothetical protein